MSGVARGTIRALKRCGWTVLLPLLFLCLVVAPAAGQNEAEGAAARAPSGEVSIFTTFGWGNAIPADRWGPVLVEIGAMERPVAGTIVIEYPQDNTQTSQIAVPFATTPGQTTRIQAVAAIPMNVSRLTVSAIDERGRRLASVSYGMAGVLQLPPFVQAEQVGLVVSVGRVSAGDALAQWSHAAFDYNIQRTGFGAATGGSNLWYGATFSRYEPADLPLSWPAYDAVTALVVNADAASEVDPRAIEAIGDWVRSGGRLVVLAATAGDEWRRWLPSEAPPPVELGPVELGPVELGPVPEEVDDAVREFDRELQRRAEALEDTGMRHEPLTPAAATAPQRRITLTDAGRAGLWSLRWTDGEPERATSGLIAEGPVELGWVTVVGLDPARATEVLSGRSAGAIWRDALETIGADLLQAPSGSQNYWGYQPPSSVAIGAAIERAGRVPFVGESVFLTIVICVLLLAALVGPVDYFVLRKLRRSQRSWLTALGWIALAGLGAYSLPPLIRTEPTQFNRLAVVDAVCTPTPGSPFARATHGWFTAVTGLYASQSGRVNLEGTEPTSWWRGIAPPMYYWEGGGRGGAVVPVLQAAAGGEAGSTRGAPLTRMTVPIWTFRTMMDQSRERLNLQVRLTRDAQGWNATVLGLPAGAVVMDAALRDGAGWRLAVGAPQRQDPGAAMQNPNAAINETLAGGPSEPAPIGAHDTGEWSGRFGPLLPKVPYGWQSERGVSEYGGMAADTSDDPGPVLFLPGAFGRGSVVDHYAAGERHAAVYLRVDNWPAGPRLSWQARYSTTRILRLVIPLPQSTPELMP